MAEQFDQINPFDVPRNGQEHGTILIAGEAGNGKTSTFNLLVGTYVGVVDDSPCGVTTEVQLSYGRDSKSGKTYKLYDTPGLSEGRHGHGEMAKESLETVVKQRCSTTGNGINAVLMVFRRGVISASSINCYNYLHQIRGRNSSNVPFIAVITHYDEENGGDQNRVKSFEEEFIKYKMEFAAIIPACAAPLPKPEIKQPGTISKRRKETKEAIFVALSKFITSPGWKPTSWIGGMLGSVNWTNTLIIAAGAFITFSRGFFASK